MGGDVENLFQSDLYFSLFIQQELLASHSQDSQSLSRDRYIERTRDRSGIVLEHVYKFFPLNFCAGTPLFLLSRLKCRSASLFKLSHKKTQSPLIGQRLWVFHISVSSLQQGLCIAALSTAKNQQ